nr:BLUF domain-containing protein [Thiorhodococcus minor]
MEAFAQIHAQTISDYHRRRGVAFRDPDRAVEAAEALWRYVRALYAGYGLCASPESPVEAAPAAATFRASALVHLIYVSTATQPLSAAELEKVLDASVRHNAPQGVTGMLLYASGSFMQVLEGEVAAIDETFSRIVEDPRHTAIMLLHRGPLSARRFQSWSMGFRHLGAEDAAAHPEYAPFFQQGFNASRIDGRPGLALDMLAHFRPEPPGH